MGGGAGFMSSRGTANLLTRTTAVLAVGFFLTSLLLSWLASYDRKPSSIITGVRRRSRSRPVPRRRLPADERRHPGFAEEIGCSVRQNQPAPRARRRPLAIKQGGHAGRALPSCISSLHQETAIRLNFEVTHSRSGSG